jgi:hypothetical protein
MAEDEQFRTNMMEGAGKFQSARSRAFWQEMMDHLRGKPAELLSFEDIRARLRLRGESYKGLQDVPLDKIVGSVGRYKDFTRNFLPKSNIMQERWSRVYASFTSMEGVPPIELYKVGDMYFVRDGNHRVSVARQLGSKTIEAHVTELPTSIGLKPNMSPQELDDATAYAAFLEEAGLQRTRPHHQPMNLSEKSRYADLLGHIYIHKEILEQVEKKPITLTKAAAHWYDSVYRPAVTLIRKYDILEQSKDRTEGDLYLWLVDHLSEVRNEFGEEAPIRKFSTALANFLEEHKLDVPDGLLEEGDKTALISRTQIMKAVQLRQSEDDSRDGQESRSYINPSSPDEV